MSNLPTTAASSTTSTHMYSSTVLTIITAITLFIVFIINVTTLLLLQPFTASMALAFIFISTLSVIATYVLILSLDKHRSPQ